MDSSWGAELVIASTQLWWSGSGMIPRRESRSGANSLDLPSYGIKCTFLVAENTARSLLIHEKSARHNICRCYQVPPARPDVFRLCRFGWNGSSVSSLPWLSHISALETRSQRDSTCPTPQIDPKLYASSGVELNQPTKSTFITFEQRVGDDIGLSQDS